MRRSLRKCVVEKREGSASNFTIEYPPIDEFPNFGMVEFEKKWAVVKRRLTHIVSLIEVEGGPLHSNDEFFELYTIVYKICTERDGTENTQLTHYQLIRDRYLQFLQEYVHSTVLPPLQGKEGELMLVELVRRWTNYKALLQMLSKTFDFSDRQYSSKLPISKPVNTSGLLLFLHDVYDGLKEDIVGSVLTLIDRERDGEQIEWELIRNILKMLSEFHEGTLLWNNYYESDFETHLLEATVEYYSRKGASTIDETSCEDYLVLVEDCLTGEEERVGRYLQATTGPKLLKKVRLALVTKYKTQLLEKLDSCFCALLEEHKVDDLARIYRMLGPTIPEGLEFTARMVGEQVTKDGITLVEQANHAISNSDDHYKGEETDIMQAVVGKLIDLNQKYRQLVSLCFASAEMFKKAVVEAFVFVCSKRVGGRTVADILAAFCDCVLRRGQNFKDFSDLMIDEMLGEVVKLLEYVIDRDVFTEHCRKNLGRRLLFGKTADKFHEIRFLARMSIQWGAKFTSKMEGMVANYTMSFENKKEIREYLAETSESSLSIGFSARVLSGRDWPSYESTDLVLPREMAECVEVFKGVYEKATKNQKLTWIYALDSCIIEAHFDAASVELTVSAMQAAALALFNGEERLSYKEIKSQLNLSDCHVDAVLHSLSCAKYEILVKEPNTKVIGQSDLFTFNAKFTSDKPRIKIRLPPLDEEKKKVMNHVEQDRKYAIDATLVRIMKSRKKLDHQQLVKECMEQCKPTFQPDLKAIKRRIEALIDRDFLKHDTDNRDMYEYIA